MQKVPRISVGAPPGCDCYRCWTTVFRSWNLSKLGTSPSDPSRTACLLSSGRGVLLSSQMSFYLLLCPGMRSHWCIPFGILDQMLSPTWFFFVYLWSSAGSSHSYHQIGKELYPLVHLSQQGFQLCTCSALVTISSVLWLNTVVSSDAQQLEDLAYMLLWMASLFNHASYSHGLGHDASASSSSQCHYRRWVSFELTW